MKARRVLIAVIALLAVASLAAVAAPDAFTLQRSVIGGGGGHAALGAYSLDGTIGQAVVGTASNAPYDICSGFWCGAGRYSAYLPLSLRTY